jgi:hypothetical protein
MKNISREEFGELVVRYFEPLVQQVGLSLKRFTQERYHIFYDVFEIAGSDFFMRIRRGIGPNKIFFITLSKTNLNLEDIGDIREDEIGLGHFALHDGYDLLHHSLDSLENWQQALKESADAARELCVPYLQGKRNDFEEIRENARRKGEEAARPFRQICFPPNVIKKW